MVLLFAEAVGGVGRALMHPGRIVVQMAEMGYRSLPLAAFTGFFAGMVISLQLAIMNPDNFQAFIGWFVGAIMINEFGPVFTAIIIAGRVGAAMTAEISTMKVTEEIDALRSMGISPVHFLVTPRIMAATVMVPILTIFSVWIGILGGQLVAVTYLNTPQGIFWNNLVEHMAPIDFFRCLVKACVFGAVISTIGCHAGLKASGGAEGVGRATTKSVVISLTMILLLDYLVTRFLYIGGGW